jgi:hypothetical protein
MHASPRTHHTHKKIRERAIARALLNEIDTSRCVSVLSFTCFTSTKVQILALTRYTTRGQKRIHQRANAQGARRGTQFTCFPRTKVHILPQKALLYLLYWYKSTNTDPTGAARNSPSPAALHLSLKRTTCTI